MIQDFDGPEPAVDRRRHFAAVSVLVTVGVAAAYAAVSSPELRGPFATARPSAAAGVAAPSPRFTPELSATFNGAGGPFPLVLAGRGCVPPGASPTPREVVVFVGPRAVSVFQEPPPLPTCDPRAIGQGQAPSSR